MGTDAPWVDGDLDDGTAQTFRDSWRRDSRELEDRRSLIEGRGRVYTLIPAAACNSRTREMMSYLEQA